MGFNYNHTTLVGRLTKDPEVKQMSDAIKGSFTLAVDRPYRKEGNTTVTDFITVVVWGRLAEISQQYLKKG